MSKKKLIFKGPGEGHFAKDFGEGTKSDRVILPGADECGVKVTIFRPKEGFSIPEGIVYEYDETVYIVSGQVKLHLTDGGSDIELYTGSSYHVPAGVSYGLTAITDCVVFCTFSPVQDGPMPDDE
ncbi:DUF861 domain-containing protein [Patescibacteria group bacterium]|nr:DUF861 domain-containing protein [Patescibacteria group bacterium]